MFKPNKRQVAIIKELVDQFITENIFSELHFNVVSKNTFPTAAGCASSASGGACLTTCLKGLFLDVYKRKNSYIKDLKNLEQLELSSLARRVSGSASRSVYGGFVEWETSGVAKQVFDEKHWEDFTILLMIVSDKRKDYSSTDGMKLSLETSEF